MVQSVERAVKAERADARRHAKLVELGRLRGIWQHRDEPRLDVLRARGVASALDLYPIAAHDGRPLAGVPALDALSSEAEEELRDLRRRIIERFGRLRYGPLSGGVGGHRVIDFPTALRLGLGGIRAELERWAGRRRPLGRPGPSDFDEASRLSLAALSRFKKRHLGALKASIPPNDPVGHPTLPHFERAVEEPAESFAEALQTVWFLQFAMAIADDITCAGRPDQYLWEYYKRDRETGRLERGEAARLIADFYRRHNELFGRWPATIMLGGRDAAGRVVSNELSYLFLDAVEEVGLVNPNVAIAVTRETPPPLIERGLRILGRGFSHPAFFNDDLISSALQKAGVAKSDSHLYQNVTCVEIAPIGSADVQVNQASLHLAKVLEVMLAGGRQTVESPFAVEAATGGLEAKTFEAFLEAYKDSIALTLEREMERAIAAEDRRAAQGSTPLVSCFTQDCLERGADACAGGARYRYCGADAPGFVTAVDSLAALRLVVFERRLMGLAEFAAVVSSDFAGHEPLRRWIMEHAPKFGNDDERADALARELYGSVTHQLSRYRTSDGGRFYIGLFSGWGPDHEGQHRGKHVSSGSLTGATPDGRKAGMPLSENVGPVAGADRRGVTAMLNSSAKLDQSLGLGGISLNCRLPAEMLKSEGGLKQAAGLLRGYFAQGGFQLQFNAVDSATLRQARERPDDFPNLAVRIAGYSDYFNRLDPRQQDEIIARAEHLDGLGA